MSIREMKETDKDAKNCLERILKQLDKEYDENVASKFIEAIYSIGQKKLLNKEEIQNYADKFVNIIERYIWK